MYQCHLCGKKLVSIISLGQQPLANRLLNSPDQIDDIWYDATWSWCDDCKLLMLVDPPSPDIVFESNYPYLTGQSKFMNEHFEKTAHTLYHQYNLDSAKVIEIGCNDGGMIQYLAPVYDILGFEPASACWPILEAKGIPHRRMKFDARSARETAEAWGKANLVYCANTLRSLKDLRGFFMAVLEMLYDDGVFVIEDPYIVDIVNRNEFDQFYSEYVYGFTITSMQNIARMFGMEVIDIDPLPDNHGGSLRWHMARVGKRPISTNVEALKVANSEFALKDKLNRFQQMIDDISTMFVDELVHLRDTDKKVVGYGATAKSVTLLNYANIDSELLPVIYDTTPTKVGKYLPGVHVPIRDAKEFSDVPKGCIVILFPYNLKREIFDREKGRRWLLYFPSVHYEESDAA